MLFQIIRDFSMAIDGTLSHLFGHCSSCPELPTGFWTFSTWLWIRIIVFWILPLLMLFLKLLTGRGYAWFKRYHYFCLLPLDFIGIITLIQDVHTCHFSSSLPLYAILTIVQDFAFSILAVYYLCRDEDNSMQIV